MTDVFVLHAFTDRFAKRILVRRGLELYGNVLVSFPIRFREEAMAILNVAKTVVGASVANFGSSILRNLLGSPLGRQILADVIVAAAGAATVALTRGDAMGRSGKGPRAGGVAKEALRGAASVATGLIANAAREMVPGESKSEPKRTRTRKQ